MHYTRVYYWVASWWANCIGLASLRYCRLLVEPFHFLFKVMYWYTPADVGMHCFKPPLFILAMVHTTATIVTSVSRNTRTTKGIDQVGATSTVLAWIRTAFVDFYNKNTKSKYGSSHLFHRTAFVDFYNTKFPSENIFSIGVTLLYSQLM